MNTNTGGIIRPLRLLAALAFASVFAIPVATDAGGKSDRSALDDLRKESTLVRQSEATRDRIAALQKKLATIDDKDAEDDIEDSLEILEFVRGWVERTLRSHPSEKDVFSVNTQVSRILAGIDDPVQGDKYPPLPALFSNVVLDGTFGHPVPRLSSRKQNRKLGRRGAEKESVFLYDPRDRSFYTAEEMAAMTPLEVSRLDVSPGHPAWYTEAEFAGVREGRLQAFERELQVGMNQALRAKDDLKKNEFWDLQAARKVMFMEEIYFSATSPKGAAEDAYGVSWKVKWGDEAAVEPVASRLYLLAGGRITDGNFISGFGPDDFVLVLNEPGKYEESEDDTERFPETVEQLKKTLEDFYGFDLTPYVLGSGVITEGNVDEILKNHPGEGKKKYEKDNVIGRQWVSFREIMVELKPKGYIRRFEAARFSDLAAIHDRAARGNYLFSLWISNRDVKDDNAKAYFLKAPDGKKEMVIKRYEEGQHDLGLSLGSLFSSGEVNGFETGRDFGRVGLFRSKFRFPQSFSFKPEAWDAATWADIMWMARKITAMTEGEIRGAVAFSGWPDFAREALVYKLMDRRNRIGELFELTDRLDRYPVDPPDFALRLGTEDEIRSAEKRYGLPAGSLQRELTARGVGPGYVDVVLSGGQIASGVDSVLVGSLVRYRYPSGLADRYERMSNKNPPSIK